MAFRRGGQQFFFHFFIHFHTCFYYVLDLITHTFLELFEETSTESAEYLYNFCVFYFSVAEHVEVSLKPCSDESPASTRGALSCQKYYVL